MICASPPTASPALRFSRLILAAVRRCTAHSQRQSQYTAPLATISEVSTDAATATVFLYIYIPKEKQYSSRSKNQLENCEGRLRWNSASKDRTCSTNSNCRKASSSASPPSPPSRIFWWKRKAAASPSRPPISSSASAPL